MRSMPQALLWEMFSHGRWSLPGFFLLGNAIPLLTYSALSRIGIDANDPAFITLQFSFLPLVIFQFAVGIVVAQGPMARLYAAPISANSIVAWHMFSGGILLALETAAAAWLYNWLFDVGWPVWAPALFAAAVWASYQLLLCVSASQSLTAFGIALLPGTALFLWLQSRYGDWFSAPKHYWSEVTASEMATLIGVIAISYPITAWGVRRARCGEGLPSLGIGNWLVKTWDAITSRSAAEPPPFRSPAHAQFWYEWRLKGWVLPITLAAVLLVAGLGSLIEFELGRLTRADLYQGILAIGGILSMLAIGAGLFLGASVGTNVPRQRDLSLADLSGQFDFLGHFQATRPIKNIDFAKATLKTAALSSAIAWATWFTLFAVYVIVSRAALRLPDPIFPPGLGAWYLPLTILGPWAAMANTSVIGLSGRAVWFTIPIVGFTLACALLPGLLSQYASPSVQARVGWTCMVTASAAIVSVGLWAYAKAHRKGIRGLKAVAIAATVFCAIVIAAVALKPFALHFAAYPMIFAFAALVVMPFATVPLAIGWNRHR